MNNKTLRLGMQHLIQVDPDIKEAFIELGMPEARMRSSGFEVFLFTIISQQLSSKVATAIMERVLCLMEGVTPEQFIKI